MTATRTTCQTVTFTRPFSLSGLDGVQPAGAYTVETDEELLQTLSFPAHRRLETRIRLPGCDGGAGFEQVACVDPAELDEALARDAAETAAATEKCAPTSVRRRRPDERRSDPQVLSSRRCRRPAPPAHGHGAHPAAGWHSTFPN